nr:DUF5801 repeats-in-toxin domain-containing protein [Marinobacterium stanieri]
MDSEPVSVTLDLGKLFSNLDGEITFEISGLPDGLTFDSLTGKIEGLLTAPASQGGNDGVYTIRLTGTGQGGETHTQTFKWTITNPAPEAVNDTNSTDENTVLNVDNAEGILSNDSDPDGDDLHVATIQTPDQSNETPVVDAGVTVPGDNGGTFTVYPNGSYDFDPNGEFSGLNPGDEATTSITYTISDGEGGTDTATLTVTVTGLSDGAPSLDITNENGAEAGEHSIAENADQPVTGTFTVTTPDGLQQITVDGSTVTAGQMENLSTSPVTIPGTEGLLKLTGFDPETGDVTYEYQQSGSNKDHSAGDDSITDIFTLTVTDQLDNTTSPQDLTILVTDTEPEAKADRNTVTEGDVDAATGNVFDGSGASTGDVADVPGADATTLTGVMAGTPTTDHVSDGNLATEITGQYGTLVLNSTGTYTYELDNTNPVVNGLKDDETLEDVFSYTLTDNDGDQSTTTLTIVIDGVTDGAPTITPRDHNGGEDSNDLTTYGQATVYERGLVESDDSDKTNGAIDVEASDGIKSVSLGGQTFALSTLQGLDPVDSDTHISITTDYGTLTLTGFTETDQYNGIPTAGTLAYDYVLTTEYSNTAPAEGENGFDQISLQVTDVGDVTDTGTLNVNIIDDVPTANADIGELTEDTPSLTNNVFTNDRIGGDGPDSPGPITGVKPGSDTATDANGNVGSSVAGEYGQITLDAHGAYTYTLDNTLPVVQNLSEGETLTETFVYTITDDDGDTSTTTLTLTINGQDDPPAITPVDGNEGDANAAGQATVYESSLDNVGTDAANTLDSTTGEITVDSKHGLEKVIIGGTDITESQLLAASESTPVTIDTTYGTLSITGYTPDNTDTDSSGNLLDGSGTISYTYALKGSTQNHDQGENNETLMDSITLTVADRDASSQDGTGTLDVTIVDDKPVIAAGTADPTLTVDESDFITNASADFSGLFGEINYGADGQADTDASSFKMTINNPDSGLVDTATGQTVVLSQTPDGVVEGKNESGELVFTVSLETDGTITLNQSRAVSHADTTNPDDQVTLTSDVLSLDLIAVDKDGDATKLSQNIGDRLIFRDDGPTITVGKPAFNPGPLQTQDAQTASGSTSTAVVDYADAFNVASKDAGSDGEQSEVWTYALSLAEGASTSLTSGGDAITLSLENGVVLGKTGDGSEVFRVSVGGDGKVTLTQSEPIDHPTMDDVTEIASLEADLISLTGTATLTDGDGDTAEDSQSINLGSIQFQDDGPSIGTPGSSTVSEANLETGSAPNEAALTQTGTLSVNTGADDEAALFDTAFAADQASLDGLSLTSGGTPVVWSLDTAGHVLTATAGDGGPVVFTATIKDPASSSASYEFELHTPLDNPVGGEAITLPFDFVVADADLDTAANTFEITVVDDNPDPAVSQNKIVDEDSGEGDPENTFTTNADATGNNTSIDGGTPDADGWVETPHGKAKVNENGTISYEPNPNFSGDDIFTYTTVTDNDTKTYTVEVKVNPISDVPGVTSDTANVITDEDVAVAVGLNTPTITDPVQETGAGDADYPERLGAISLEGVPAGVKILDGANADTELFTTTGEPVTVLIQEYLDGSNHLNGLSASDVDLVLTQAQYDALKVLPPAHDADNFIVTASVDSYEVDVNGNQLSGVPSANNTTSVNVEVIAITDPVVLAINGSDEGSYTATLNEDTPLDLTALLSANFNDIDGSEGRELVIEGLPVGSVVSVGGSSTTIDASGAINIPAPGLSESTDSFPSMTITPPKDFSGDINDISVTLKAVDTDGDTDLDSHGGKPGEETSTVTLNMHVNPVAGDVNTSSNQETPEDTAVAFLSGVQVTDTGADGTEIITEVSFTVPSDANGSWAFEKAASGEGSDWEITSVGDSHTISALNDYNLAEILSDFTLTPPAHSSLDASVDVTVTSADSQTVNGSTVTSAPVTTNHTVRITVTPVAETFDPSHQPTDTDGNGTDDIGMSPNHEYQTEGQEDQWFKLGTENTFNLKDDWTVEDDEQLFAALTPELTATNGTQTNPVGSQFRYSEDGGDSWITQTFGGDAVRIPVEYLDTLEFKGAENFSGQFKINVQALTIDTDDDGGQSVEAISGLSELTNVLIKPVADAVTTTVTARVNGDEDAQVPLSIRPSSSDPSETYKVTIDEIPNGAVLKYGADEISNTNFGGYTVTDNGNGTWKLVIEDFDPATGSTGMAITAPEHSNEPFTLKVGTVAVDSLTVDGNLYENESASFDLTINVTPKGVADPASVDLKSLDAQGFVEESVDAAGGVMLSDLFNSMPALIDADGSETLSFKLKGLPEGFGVEGATSLGNGEWVFTPGDWDNIKVTTPKNFGGDSGTFVLSTITTENDGHSRTDDHDLQIRVEPSPEATMNLSGSADEDTPALLDFGVQQQNEETGESITAVWIKQADVDGAAGFSLTVGATGEQLDGTAEGVTLEDGWYKLDEAAMGNIYLKGDANWHGSGSFGVQYEVTDQGNNAAAGSTASLSGEQTYNVSVNPVTDQPGLTLVSSNDISMTAPGITTIDLNVANQGVNGGDYDGSEQLTRILLDGVPEGVTVQGADFIGGSQWLFVTGDSFNAALDKSISLDVHYEADDLTDHPISITVTTEDAANGQLLTDSISVNLTTNFEDGPGSAPPAVIVDWSQTDFDPTEDTSFVVSDAFNGEIESGVTGNGFNITLSNVPEGTQISGMTETVINGETVWTASGMGGNAELQTLMQNISITPPADWNINKGTFDFDAKLTTYVSSGLRNEAVIEPSASFAVQPVSDTPEISISAPAVDEGSDLTFTVDLANSADAPDWSLVDGKLYLQLDDSGIDGTGVLKQGATELAQTSVSGINGVPDGSYYVIEGVDPASSVVLTYTPSSTHSDGSVSLSAWAQGTETGSDLVVTGTSAETGVIQPVNSGYDFSVAPASGLENGSQQAEADKSNVIQLNITDNGLNDTDGSESIGTVLLRDIPNGFLVFVGDSAEDASLAELSNNAGGDGTANTWLLGQGEIPAYVGVMPPQYWSGTLNALKLQITSGETSLASEGISEELFDLVVEPVADGLNSLSPTPSFGTEGDIIQLNINHELADPEAVGPETGDFQDESSETLTLEFSGMGEHAAFYLDGVLISGTSQVVDNGGGNYTLNGLTPEEAEQLGFMQAAGDLDNVQVRARTEESGGGEPSAWTEFKPIDTSSVTEQFGTSGNDELLWTGQAIDGFGGEDVVQLRFDEGLTGSELGASLANIESLDMTGMGSNAITNLSAQDVLDMTDSRNSLKISGEDVDSVNLDSDSGWTADSNTGGYTSYSATMAGGETVTLEVQNTLVE